MARFLAIAFALLVAVPACEAPVRVRACNQTVHDFAVLKFSIYQEPMLAAGDCSAYYEADDDVYRYTNASFFVGDVMFEIRPKDYVGETPLDSGSWSYNITIGDFAARTAAIAAVED